MRARHTRPTITIAFIGLALLALGGLASDGLSRTRAEQRPNIVVVMTDDQTLESMRVMANVQQLIAAHGVSFRESFVSFSLCCPSRATFLTGQYAHNHGVLDNQLPGGGYQKLDHSRTLPVWLQRAGYATIHVGKYLNGYGVNMDARTIPPGWTEWYASPDPLNGYNYFNYSLNENGKLVYYGSGEAAYKTDVYTRRAVDVIERRAPSSQPFFLWVAYLAPHDGGPGTGRPLPSPLPAPRHAGRFANASLPMPPSFNEQDVSDKPLFIRSRPLLTTQQIEVIRQQYRLRLETLLAVDEGVAAIVEALERAGELDRTLIVFTSDNGYFQGEHRIPEGKIFLYEPSIRVPLLMRGPGIPKGVRLQEQVSNLDLAPTILDAANATPDRVVDGRSLLPLFLDPGLRWGRDLLIEGPARTGDVSDRAFVGIRTPRYLYAERFTGERELYDLERDPYELESRPGDPAYSAIRDELARRLSALRRCVGDTCRTGPAVSLTARFQGKCRRPLLRLGIAGRDARRAWRVQFFVAGRRIATDVKPPFTLRTRKARATVRVQIGLFDGREVTRQRRVSCR